jgi:hypothetical protein
MTASTCHREKAQDVREEDADGITGSEPFAGNMSAV